MAKRMYLRIVFLLGITLLAWPVVAQEGKLPDPGTRYPAYRKPKITDGLTKEILLVSGTTFFVCGVGLTYIGAELTVILLSVDPENPNGSWGEIAAIMVGSLGPPLILTGLGLTYMGGKFILAGIKREQSGSVRLDVGMGAGGSPQLRLVGRF